MKRNLPDDPPLSTNARQRADVALFLTELGWMAAVGSDRVLYRLAFGHASKAHALAAVSGPESGALQLAQRPWCPGLVEMLDRYASGDEVDFSDIELNLAHLRPFHACVVAACRRVGYGETISYGQLATKAGSPGAARAVGNCMAANRFPLIVPCHRVVNADGSIGHFSAPQGPGMKQRLLELERRGAWSGGLGRASRSPTRPSRAARKEGASLTSMA